MRTSYLSGERNPAGILCPSFESPHYDQRWGQRPRHTQLPSSTTTNERWAQHLRSAMASSLAQEHLHCQLLDSGEFGIFQCRFYTDVVTKDIPRSTGRRTRHRADGQHRAESKTFNLYDFKLISVSSRLAIGISTRWAQKMSWLGRMADSQYRVFFIVRFAFSGSSQSFTNIIFRERS